MFVTWTSVLQGRKGKKKSKTINKVSDGNGTTDTLDKDQNKNENSISENHVKPVDLTDLTPCK